MEDKFTIHLKKIEQIAGIPIPFRIEKKDEAKYREAEKQVTELHTKYVKSLKNSSLKEIDKVALVMSGLELAIKRIESDNTKEYESVNQEIKTLNEDLQHYINND